MPLSAGYGPINAAKIRIALNATDTADVEEWRIRQVKRLRPELNACTLRNAKVFEDREIQVFLRRCVIALESESTPRSGEWRGYGRSIEIKTRGASVSGCILRIFTWDQVGHASDKLTNAVTSP